MPLIKNRERLQEAAVSTVKAISQNKKISSNTGLSQRPPKKNNILIPAAPRSKHDLNKWRGESDFQAFWHLFHKSLEEVQLILPAKMIFNELEISRVEIIGSKEYKGCKKNISAFTNERSSNLEDHKSLNFISYGANLWLKDAANFDLSEDSKYVLSKFIEKYKIDDSLNTLKQDLTSNINNQKIFQNLSLEFLKKINLLNEVYEEEHEENLDDSLGNSDNIEDEKNQTSELSEENVDVDIIDVNPQMIEDTQNQIEGIDDLSIQEELESLSYPKDEFKNFVKDYSIYTTKFDEVIEAKDLVTLDESIRLRNQLDNLIKPYLPTIGKLANRLQRLLLAKQNTDWTFNLEEGVLDNARLNRIITNPNYPLSFKQESVNNFKDTVVTLLIDNSGSMRGRSISLAAICGDIIGSTLERCQVKTEILGFTTKHWKGGDSKKMWIINGNSSYPGRLNDIRHIIYKSADNSWRRSRKYFGAMLREGLLKENVDGEALAWSHERLIKRPEERKILIVISDGAPVDDSTLSANREDFLDNHLKEIISKIENDSPVELQAIGIGHDVTKYYKNSLTINRADELGEVLLDELTKLFND
tara:strand:+ start:1115 stop:2878 length:1764 start_codon:yes stop_codon:yes gene_type:complete